MDRLAVLDALSSTAARISRCCAKRHYAALWRRQSGGFIDAGDVQAAE
jgi:hypothetical protein